MKLIEIKNKTAKLRIFSKDILKNFEKNANTLDANIKYWLNSDDLIALKNGLYTFSEQYKNEVNKDAFLEYAAGQLVTPSYLSLEYIMSKYQLLSEPVRSITSVTNKSTREYKNKLGVFRYYTINPKLFCGYEAKFIDTAPIMVATKSKAVFDYLYLRFIKNTPINENEIKELRINWENISAKEFDELAGYAVFARSNKIKMAIALIKKM